MANTSATERSRAQDSAGQAQHAAGQAMQHGRDAAGTAADKAREAASSVADKARDAAGTVADKAREAAGSVAGAAREAVGDVSKAASHGVEAAGHAVDAATGRVGEGLQSLAHTVHDRGPQGGVLGSATESVAKGLEQGGQYLQQEGFTGMMDDMTELIKRNPIPALLVGIGIGFILARATRS